MIRNANYLLNFRRLFFSLITSMFAIVSLGCNQSAEDKPANDVSDSKVANSNGLDITQAVETIGAGKAVEILERSNQIDYHLSARELELLWWIAESEPDVRYEVLQRFFSNAKYRGHFLKRPYMIANAVVGLDLDLRERIANEIIKPAIASSAEDKEKDFAIAVLGSVLRLGSSIPNFSQFTTRSFHSKKEIQKFEEEKRSRTSRDFLKFFLVRIAVTDLRKDDVDEFFKLAMKKNNDLIYNYRHMLEQSLEQFSEEQLNTIADFWLVNTKKAKAANRYITYSLIEKLAPRIGPKKAKTILDFLLDDYLNINIKVSGRRTTNSSSTKVVLKLLPKLNEADQNELFAKILLALEKQNVRINQNREYQLISFLAAIPGNRKGKDIKQVISAKLKFHKKYSHRFQRHDIFSTLHQPILKLLEKTEPSDVPELVSYLLKLQQEAIDKKSRFSISFRRYLQIWIGGACKNITTQDSSKIIAKLDEQVKKELSHTLNSGAKNDSGKEGAARTTTVSRKYPEAYYRLIQKLPLEELNKRYLKLEEIEDGTILASLIARYATQKNEFSSKQRVNQFELLITTCPSGKRVIFC